MLKKLIAIIVGAILGLTLASCGSREGDLPSRGGSRDTAASPAEDGSYSDEYEQGYSEEDQYGSASDPSYAEDDQGYTEEEQYLDEDTPTWFNEDYAAIIQNPEGVPSAVRVFLDKDEGALGVIVDIGNDVGNSPEYERAKSQGFLALEDIYPFLSYDQVNGIECIVNDYHPSRVGILAAAMNSNTPKLYLSRDSLETGAWKVVSSDCSITTATESDTAAKVFLFD